MSIEDQTTLPVAPDGQETPDTGGLKASPLTKSSKSHLITKLLRRAKGATLSELQEVTAWQPHSVRAFLSGLRKKGATVTKEQRKSGETAYRIFSKSAAEAGADA